MKIFSRIVFSVAVFLMLGVFGLGDNTLKSAFEFGGMEATLADHTARISGLLIVLLAFGFYE